MKASKNIKSRYHQDKLLNFLNQNAVVIDVRSKSEREKMGFDPQSLHIDYHSITEELEDIRALNKPIVVVCVSGMRSGQISEFLNTHGIQSINGGNWRDINELINTLNLNTN